MNCTFILTLSCPDKPGIVAAVSSFLAERGGFIIESAQFGDASTNQFFMRTVFSLEQEDHCPLVQDAFGTDVAKAFQMDWQLLPHDHVTRVLIMVSKASHCLNDLLHRRRTGQLPIDIVGIVSNHDALSDMAAWHEIPFHHLPITKDNKHEQEAQLLELVGAMKTELVVLARYMQILSPETSSKLHGRAINIHHSFLPGFKGANPYQQAYDRGVKLIGATAHYVTEDLDEGPIIDQETMHVSHEHTPALLKQMGQDIESRVLARAVRAHVEQRVVLNGSKTVIF